MLTVNNPSIIASSSFSACLSVSFSLSLCLFHLDFPHWDAMLYVNCVDINHGSFDCDGSKLATQGFLLVGATKPWSGYQPQTGCPLTEANLSASETRNPCGNAVNDDLKQFADLITVPVEAILSYGYRWNINQISWVHLSLITRFASSRWWQIIERVLCVSWAEILAGFPVCNH